VHWQSGSITVYGPTGGYTGEIWNQAGALWEIQCDQGLAGVWSNEKFHNGGTLQKDTTSGTTTINTIFYNSGTVDAESGTAVFNGVTTLSGGTLQFGIGSATQYGRISFPGAAGLDGNFSATLKNGFIPKVGNSFVVLRYGSETGGFNNFNLPAGANLQPNYWPGIFPLNVTNLNANSFTWTGASSSDWFDPNNWNPAGVPGTSDCINVVGGTINLTAPVTINGQLNFGGGTLSGSGLTITTNGVLNIENSLSLEGPLTNNGTVNWQAGVIYLFGDYGYTGEIWNQAGALWDIQCDQTLLPEWSDGVFHNAGLVQKDTTTGTTGFYVYLNNTGCVDSESGVISLSASYNLMAGTLAFGINDLAQGVWLAVRKTRQA
jgi:hypothetical protein